MTLRNKVSEIFVKNGMRTDQVTILELVALIQQESTRRYLEQTHE